VVRVTFWVEFRAKMKLGLHFAWNLGLFRMVFHMVKFGLRVGGIRVTRGGG